MVVVSKESQLEVLDRTHNYKHNNSVPIIYLSAKDAVNHDNDKAFQWIKHSKKDLEERRTPVGDGQDSWHPRESQEWQYHTGAPQWRPTEWKGNCSQEQYNPNFVKAGLQWFLAIAF